MSTFIDKILGKTKEKQKVLDAAQSFRFINGYDPVFTDWRGQIYESELVRAAIDARARHMSKLRPEFIGSAKPTLTNKLKNRPNKWTTWSQFLYRVSTILDCCNNALIVPVYDEDLNKVGIWALLPTRCRIVEYKDELWIKYKFYHERKSGACRLNECAILTRFQFEDDFFGSDNKPLNGTMQLIDLQNQGIRHAIKNSAIYKFMARVTNFTQKEDLEEESRNFSERAFKNDKAGGVLLFPNTYQDIKQIESKAYTVDDKQMQLIKTNVFNYFGVNEDILQNKAIGDEWSAFYEGAIEPFAVQFSDTVSRMLYSDRELAAGAELMLTANRLQYMTNTDKANVTAQLADRGLVTINELRDIWNLTPVEWGNKPVIRGEYYLLGENENTEDVKKEDPDNGDQE